MTDKKTGKRTKPRRLKGFRDLTSVDVLARNWMIERIRSVYERYGFVPLETPAIEYVDVLGKFLPEADQPDGGVFALRDDDDEWVALRYDLTAPLSRFVAMNPLLPKPYRRYQVGPVYRLEKPGPGRFREFYQFDFDTVGSGSVLADAEACMVMCDVLEALDIAPGDYKVIVNNRKLLDGVRDSLNALAPNTLTSLSDETWLQVMRTIDKRDRIGLDGIKLLLGPGRHDESGAFVEGVGLSEGPIDIVMNFLAIEEADRVKLCDRLEQVVKSSPVGMEGINELREIDEALREAGYAEDRVVFDPTVVRGLAYYTGPVFEAVLTFEIVDEDGVTQQFGSVFGGGRYDDLVERFTGQKVPATGASIGVDRLLTALATLGKVNFPQATAAVLVTQLDKGFRADYQRMAGELRQARINTELYVGKQGIGKQFKYAADSGKIVVVVMGSDEAQAGEISIKDLRLGDELSSNIGADRKRWLEEQPAQFTARRSELVDAVRKVLARYAE